MNATTLQFKTKYVRKHIMDTNNMLEKALNVKIEAVVCISLKSDEQRRQQTLEECEKINLPVKFHVVERSPLGGVHGCLESHLQVIQYAKQNKFSNILIIEDDVKFDLEALQNTNITLPEDWEMFYLGYHVNKGYRYQDNILKILSGLTTHAYILKDTMYDYILENIQKDWKSIPEFHDQNNHEKPFFKLDNHAIDIFYSKWVHHRLNKTYGVYPLIAYQRPAFSHIENQNVDYTILFKAKAEHYYNMYLGQFKGVFHINEEGYQNLNQLCRHLKTLNYSKWDYVLVSDMNNLYHERTSKDSIDIFHNNLCNEFSWDILSLTETMDEPNIQSLMTNNEREQFSIKYPETVPLIYGNKTKELYEFLSDKEDYQDLRNKLSRYHIYYLRMTYLEKENDAELINIHYSFPSLDNYEYAVYPKHIQSDKEILCIYLPDNMNYNVIKDKLGDTSSFYVYVAGGVCNDTSVKHISKRQMVNLPNHRLIIVNDIMYFADQPNHATDITLLMTQGKFVESWKTLQVPYDGRSLLYNMIDKINRLCFIDSNIKNEFMQHYELEADKETCIILNEGELDVNTKYRNRIICAYSKHIDEYLSIYNQMKKAIPNLQLYIYRCKRDAKKEFKKEKDIFVDTSRTIRWDGDVLLEYDDPELFREAIPRGIICVGKNKDYCHVLLPDTNIEETVQRFISIMLNPVKKSMIAKHIKNTFDRATSKKVLFE